MTDKLIEVRRKLADYIHKKRICFHSPLNKQKYTELPVEYPIYCLDSKMEHKNIDIGGITYSNSTEWVQITSDIQVAIKNNITSMYVLISNDWNRTMYHFIHEISHTITLNEQHKNIDDIRLQPFATENGRYTACHHPITFYRNLAILLRIAKELKLWCPSADFPGFKPEALVRFDSFTVS
jgi:hypothetical protein